jgi:peptidoglycan/LPS O-acetylase OafA/YrhL
VGSNDTRPLMGIRGLACAVVVIFHVYPILFLLLPATRGSFNELATAMLAVDFFFMLSGFVIALKYVDELARPNRRALRRFAVARVARIWPLHVAMVAAFLAYDVAARAIFDYGLEGDTSGLNVVANLFMLHEFGPFEAINVPSWSMAPELGAYLAFPLLAPALARAGRSRSAAVSLLVVWLAVGVWTLRTAYLGLDVDDWSHLVAWMRVAVSFPVGCLLAMLWRGLPARARWSKSWDVAAALAAAAAVIISVGLNRGAEFHEPVIAYPFLALLVIACAGACGPVAGFLGSGPIHWLGKMSYSVYLTHYLVVIVFFALLVRADAASASLWFRLVLLALLGATILLVGALANATVEEPARRNIRKLASGAEALPRQSSRGDTLTP